MRTVTRAAPVRRSSAACPGNQAAHGASRHVRAHLLDLGQQVRGHEDGDPLRGDLPDQRADLAGALRVEPVGRLVQDDQVAGPQQRRGQASRCFIPSE